MEIAAGITSEGRYMGAFQRTASHRRVGARFIAFATSPAAAAAAAAASAACPVVVTQRVDALEQSRDAPSRHSEVSLPSSSSPFYSSFPLYSSCPSSPSPSPGPTERPS